MIATCQRIAYNSQKRDTFLLKDNVLIEIDFKQKIIVNSGICSGPIQYNADYYSAIDNLRTLLGKL